MSSAVADFKAISGADSSTAEKYLRRYGNSLDRALDAFFADGPSQLSRPTLEKFFLSLTNNAELLETDSLLALCDKCGTPADDPVWLAIASECDAKTMGSFTREEWINGMRTLKIDSFDTLKKSIPALKKRQTSDLEFAKKIYRFAFTYTLEPGVRNIDKADALALWQVLLSDRGWPLYADWTRYVEEKLITKTISRDTWNMVWDLAHTVKPDLSNYDPSGAWPVAIDDFVDHQRQASN
jgi:Cullin binding/UBA-like domain